VPTWFNSGQSREFYWSNDKGTLRVSGGRKAYRSWQYQLGWVSDELHSCRSRPLQQFPVDTRRDPTFAHWCHVQQSYKQTDGNLETNY